MTELESHALAHLPRCLAGLRVTQVALIEDRGAESIAFHLSDAADHEGGEIQGYELRDYNPGVGDLREFISPLAIKWRDAPPVVIFDSRIHGYHGEMASSAKLRGRGLAKTFSCPRCGGETFGVTVQLDYWDACHDLWEDDPEINIQDYFCNIMVAGQCVSCRHLSLVLDMDL